MICENLAVKAVSLWWVRVTVKLANARDCRGAIEIDCHPLLSPMSFVKLSIFGTSFEVYHASCLWCHVFPADALSEF